MGTPRKSGAVAGDSAMTPDLGRVSAKERDALRDLRVLILCGGPGVEREVSLESGESARAALAAAGMAARLVDVAGADDIMRLEGDLAIPMLHGEFGEDGGVQRALDERGLAYCGSDAAASALALDKHGTKARLAAAGIPVPRGIPLRGGENDPAAALAAAGLALPVVVKPNARGSSVGVRIVRDWADLPAAVAGAFAVDDAVIVEEFIAGRELTAAVLEGRPLPLVEMLPDGDFYDYHAKYKSANTRYVCPAALPAAETGRLREMAARVFRILSLSDLARVDILLGADGPRVLEVNTAPGFTGHSLFPMAAAAAGLTLPELCLRLAVLAAGRRAGRGGASRAAAT